jgi:hypothetical protein
VRLEARLHPPMMGEDWNTLSELASPMPLNLFSLARGVTNAYPLTAPSTRNRTGAGRRLEA